MIWRVNSDGVSFSVAIWPVPDVVVDYGDSLTKTKIVRGELKGIFTATNIRGTGRVKQCRVTYHQVSEQGAIHMDIFDLLILSPHKYYSYSCNCPVQSIKAGGFMPKSVINNKLVPHQLMVVKRAIDYFKRDAEVSFAIWLCNYLTN